MSEPTGPMNYACLKATGADTLGAGSKTAFISPSGVVDTTAADGLSHILTNTRRGETSVLLAGPSGTVALVGDAEGNRGEPVQGIVLGTAKPDTGKAAIDMAKATFDKFMANKNHHSACKP